VEECARSCEDLEGDRRLMEPEHTPFLTPVAENLLADFKSLAQATIDNATPQVGDPRAPGSLWCFYVFVLEGTGVRPESVGDRTVEKWRRSRHTLGGKV
jgi:hypothetical protein